MVYRGRGVPENAPFLGVIFSTFSKYSFLTKSAPSAREIVLTKKPRFAFDDYRVLLPLFVLGVSFILERAAGDR